VTPVRLPHASRQRIGLLVVEIAAGGPAAGASLLPGDILLGTDEKEFRLVGDLSAVLEEGSAPVLRLEFLRGDYERVRKVSVQLRAREKRGAIAA